MNNMLHLFEGFGVELEYMVVDRETLDPKPIVEQLFHDISGTAFTTTISRGTISWSNELTNHVLELKTSRPSALQDIANTFQSEIQSINRILLQYHAQLMPTAMHPWMDPVRDFYLWPSGKDHTICEAYHRIFNCQNHGWSNIQSVQLNLPFCGDEEFARLHTAIRLLLPILPALSASSPIVDGMLHGWASSRLQAYSYNQMEFPEIKGLVIPEAIFSQQEYEERILQPIYKTLTAVDADGILQKEWINSRGAIARFDRSTIEIRVLDIQESPKMDLLILRLIVAVIRALVEERWISFQDQTNFSVSFLHAVFLAVAQQGFSAVCDNLNYLKAFHYLKPSANLREIWITLTNLVTEARLLTETDCISLRRLFECGNLSERIVQAVAFDTSREKLRSVYRSLMEALHQGAMWAT